MKGNNLLGGIMKWLVLIALVGFLMYILPSTSENEIVVHEIKKEQNDDERIDQQKVDQDKKYHRRWS